MLGLNDEYEEEITQENDINLEDNDNENADIYDFNHYQMTDKSFYNRFLHKYEKKQGFRYINSDFNEGKLNKSVESIRELLNSIEKTCFFIEGFIRMKEL